MTQEQLAEQLFVSRTAVSKWETGRGTPSMESLKQIAKLFHITLDQLLSTEEIVVIAESENKENIKRFAAYIDGTINLAALLGLLLPLYKVEENGLFHSVPLYQLGGWQGTVFWTAPVIMVICGIVQMLLVGREKEKLSKTASAVGTAVHISAIVLLILCGHPYPAVLFFLFAMKGILLLKNANDTQSIAHVTAGFYPVSAPFDRINTGLQPQIYQRSRFANEKKSNLTINSWKHSSNSVCPLHLVTDIF